MTTLSKSMIAAAAFAAVATSAFSQVPWEFKSGHGLHVCRARENVGDGHGIGARRITMR